MRAMVLDQPKAAEELPLAVGLMAKSTGYPPDDKAAEGTCCKDWDGSFCNDGVGEAEQDADEQSDSPARPRQTNIANYKSDREPSDERA